MRRTPCEQPPLGEKDRHCFAGVSKFHAVCRAGGTSLASALRVTLYLADMRDFARVNESYAEFFVAEPPARVAIQAAGLPRGADVEIDAIVAVA